MSSYYTRAQLEEMRKERIRKALDESIQKLKEQMMIKHSEVQMDTGSSIRTSVFIEEDSIEGAVSIAGVTGSTLLSAKSVELEKRKDLDLSDLLATQNKKPTKLEKELNDWVAKVDDRPIITKKDQTDRTRVMSELSKIVLEKDIDIEDKVNFVKMRVESYLAGTTKLTTADKQEIESQYYEYCALCKILQVNPIEHIPYRVKNEVVRMKAIVEKRKQDEYIMEVIEAAMEELGCHVKDDAVLDHTEGQVFSIDGHPLCDVFVGADGSGIMFEPVGESRNASLERKRRIEESANSICSLYKSLEEKAAEKGVILNRIYAEPIHVEQMCMQSDISISRERKKQKKTTTQNQRSFKLED